MEQTFKDQFATHSGNAAKMMLNLSLNFVNNAKREDYNDIENCLKDSISSACFIKADGSAQEKSKSMTNKFESTLRLMRKNNVDISKEALVAVFTRSLDKDTLAVVNSSLSSDNQKMIDNAANFEAKSSKANKFDNTGLSMS